MKTNEIHEIIQLIDELEKEINDALDNGQKNVHNTQNEYTFKNGHISSEEIDNIRNKLYEKLKTVDTYLFQKIDDGK